MPITETQRHVLTAYGAMAMGPKCVRIAVDEIEAALKIIAVDRSMARGLHDNLQRDLLAAKFCLTAHTRQVGEGNEAPTTYLRSAIWALFTDPAERLEERF